MKFGEKLKELRQKNNLKQSEVAQAVGISRRTYISYEQEGRYPRYRELYAKLADVLGWLDTTVVTQMNTFCYAIQLVESLTLQDITQPTACISFFVHP